jgi:hypothetical protein
LSLTDIEEDISESETSQDEDKVHHFKPIITEKPPK